MVKYHGLARRYLRPPRFLMRPLLNGGTLGRPEGGILSNAYMQRLAEGLVTRALKTRNVLRVGVALRRLPAVESDSERVSAAFASGALDHWEAAFLLGCIGHDAGYRTACLILNDPRLTYAGSHVGSVVAQLGGLRSTGDLLHFLSSAPTLVGREDAAWGLAHLASPDARNAIGGAALAGKIRGDWAAQLLMQLKTDAQTVERWLVSLDPAEAGFGCEVVVAAVPRRGSPSPEWDPRDCDRLLSLARKVALERNVELRLRTRGRLVNP